VDIEGAGTQLPVIRDDRDYVMVSILGFGNAAQVSAAAERLARGARATLAHDFTARKAHSRGRREAANAGANRRNPRR